MKEQEVKVEPAVGLIPEPKTMYWYIRSNMISHDFKVIEAEWIGGVSDALRLAKGNVYLRRDEADSVCLQLNNRLRTILDTIDGQRQKERIAEEAARKKEEAAKRKAERDKQVQKLTEEDKKLREERIHYRALRYEANKKRRNEKNSHPDIID